MRVLRWLSRVSCCAFVLLAAASANPAQPIDAYWRPPAYRDPVLSPNGRYLAVTLPIKGRMNVAVVDVETRQAKPLTEFEDFDVIDQHWVGNDRLVFSLGRLNTPTGPDRQDGGGLIMVHRDGSESRKLAPTLREMMRSGQRAYHGLFYLAPVRDSEDEILANEISDQGEQDVYRVNVRTGRKTILSAGRPRHVYRWVLDRESVPRVAVSWSEDSVEEIVSYRASADAPWTELYRQQRGSERMAVPLAFDDDNRTLIVAANQGRDTMALMSYDPKARRLGEVLAGHPRFDIGADLTGEPVLGAVLDSKTRQMVGVRVAAEKPLAVWNDARYERVQKVLDAALPGQINVFSGDIDGKRLLVLSHSDRQPPRWYFLHTDRHALELLFDSAPWFKPDDLVPMHPFVLKTRDGLQIPGYYLLPVGRKPGERLPTVIHIHGGPAVRADHWGYGSFGAHEAQLLASRGYAVVLPNFRITPGFGARIFRAGLRQLGRAMQEDIEDATDWAVTQGFADASRICLSGASYGGYASLMGVAKTPDKYRCSIAGLAVTDVELLLTSSEGDIPRARSGGLQFWHELAGDPKNPTDRDAMRAVSPAYLAARIKVPVLMYSGVDDVRVPLEQPQKMRKALEAAGKQVQWIQKNGEGHGFGKLENNVELYTQILQFLDHNIGSAAAKN